MHVIVLVIRRIYFGDMQKLYEIPALYDIAFRRTDVGRHVLSLIEIHSRFRKNHEFKRVLELAAGPGRHALEFAARGYQSAILDYAPDMCRYASFLARRHSLTLDVFQANMKDFAIPHQYDLAMILLNSIGHVHTHDDLINHLCAVSRHLSEDGLYVIEAHYPPWTNRDSLRAAAWNVEMDQLKLQVEFGRPEDEFDEELHIRKVYVHIFGDLPEQQVDYTDFLTIRSWSNDALEHAVRESEAFEIVRKLGALDPDFEFGEQESNRLVYVLRRLD